MEHKARVLYFLLVAVCYVLALRVILIFRGGAGPIGFCGF